MVLEIRIRIERMTPADTSGYATELAVFEDAAWALDVFNELIDDPCGYFYKAYYGDEQAGYASMYHNTMHAQHYCKIMDLRVKPAFRRKGIAKALMLTMLDTARDLGLNRAKLEVGITNDGAFKLYETLGFKTEETEEDFYDDGTAAYVMWREESK